MAAISTIIAAVGIGLSVKGQKDASDAQDKINAAKQRRANLEAMRERRQQLRQAQIASADLLSVGVQTGAKNSSALSGGQAGVQTAASSNILGINQGQEIGGQIYQAQAQQNTARGLSNFGSTLFQNSDTMGDIFGSIKTG